MTRRPRTGFAKLCADDPNAADPMGFRFEQDLAPGLYAARLRIAGQFSRGFGFERHLRTTVVAD